MNTAEVPFYIRHSRYLQEQQNAGMPPIGLSFDDVLVQPRFSTVRSRSAPGEINLEAGVAGEVFVNTPIMTANMDTITEWRMAEEIALLGGVGVMHRYLSPDEQARQVKVVKEKTRTIQDKPFSVSADATIKDMSRLKKKLQTGYFLVMQDDNLLGIVTDKDLLSNKDDSTPARLIMTGGDKLITVPEGTTLDQAEIVMRTNKIEKVPVISSEGKVVGVYTRKDAQLYKEHPSASRDRNGRLIVGAAVGVKNPDREVERAHKLVDAGVDFIIIDIAHGDSENMMVMLKRLVEDEKIKIPIIAGNIVTREAAERLIGAGAKGLKVGVGPGWACDTRLIAGVGRAQISAIASVAAIAVPQGIRVIADGGMRSPGDLVKALVAGADIGMFGGMFAGTEETPGRDIIKNGIKYRRYEGMASNKARRRALLEDGDDSQSDQSAPEGREKEVPLKGKAGEVFNLIKAGVQSGASYIDAHTIPDFRDKGNFERVTGAGASEQYGEIS